MKIHEYQGKGILKKYGVTVPRGTMAASREEADSAAKTLDGSDAPIGAGIIRQRTNIASQRAEVDGVRTRQNTRRNAERLA